MMPDKPQISPTWKVKKQDTKIRSTDCAGAWPTCPQRKISRITMAKPTPTPMEPKKTFSMSTRRRQFIPAPGRLNDLNNVIATASFICDSPKMRMNKRGSTFKCPNVASVDTGSTELMREAMARARWPSWIEWKSLVHMSRAAMMATAARVPMIAKTMMYPNCDTKSRMRTDQPLSKMITGKATKFRQPENMARMNCWSKWPDSPSKSDQHRMKPRRTPSKTVTRDSGMVSQRFRCKMACKMRPTTRLPSPNA
mmetsp:Transcript_69407/g.201114  ORF Transcript_69407/g.201114 Transcript_69407/m.201114 type:complete len:253 (-) Transcript_69407:127-885(-)